MEPSDASSMIGPKQNIRIAVAADDGTLPTSHAVSLGLIVTELIINAIKSAFQKPRDSALIRVTFEKARSDWKLTVSDNGHGKNETEADKPAGGLGTALISALAKQLEAQVSDVSTAKGVTIEITRATFASRAKRAA